LLLAPNSFEGGAEAKLEVIRRKALTCSAIPNSKFSGAEALDSSLKSSSVEETQSAETT
jgi:hypothetical protein